MFGLIANFSFAQVVAFMIISTIAIYIIGMIMISVFGSKGNVFGSKGNVFAVIGCIVGIIILDILITISYIYWLVRNFGSSSTIIKILSILLLIYIFFHDGNSARNKSN